PKAGKPDPNAKDGFFVPVPTTRPQPAATNQPASGPSAPDTTDGLSVHRAVRLDAAGNVISDAVIAPPAETEKPPAPKQGAVVDPRFTGRDASGQTYTLRADSARRSAQTGNIELSNPRMLSGGVTISADKVTLIEGAKTLVFSGNVVRQEADGS